MRFLLEAQESFALLADLPNIGTIRDYGNPDLFGLRMWPIPRFRKYLIFYVTTNDLVKIVRVLHGSQDIQSIFSPESE